MKKYILTLVGAIVLSQGFIQTNSRGLSYTISCIDGFKYLTITQGYAAVSTVQVYEKSPTLGEPAQPATCKEKQ